MMKRTPSKIFARARAFALALLVALVAAESASKQTAVAQGGRQSKEKKGAQAPAQAAPLLKRTTTRREVRRVGFGGSVTIYGAPAGSVTVEGWSKGEVEITAEVEQSADTEENLERLAALNGFVLDEDMSHLRLTTVGLHDRKFLKQAARNLPKGLAASLAAMPWKIDYHVRVPSVLDLEVYTGRGALKVTGVEGSLHVNAGDGPADFALAGGDVEATLRGGTVNVRVPARSWRGRGMTLRLASGELNVELPAGYSGDLDAEVLRAGRVENSYAGLAPRERTQTTERSLRGRIGQGGAPLSFTVGDGTIRIAQEVRKQ
ncbi:MAG TPA: hypothetical protein VM914_03060 [Pyrinomonadaceae bacterium]|jgi:hypothetical protein|nr:hypothetical protein [Pyrinomonadaceae bacterium]